MRGPIVEGVGLGRTSTLEGLRDLLKARRKVLGLPQLAVDDLAGYADGYTSKIEAGMKGLGKESIPCLLGALKVELQVVPKAMPTTSGHRGKTGDSEDFFSRRARKAVMARYAKQTPKQRSKAARAAAKARWAKAERERT